MYTFICQNSRQYRDRQKIQKTSCGQVLTGKGRITAATYWIRLRILAACWIDPTLQWSLCLACVRSNLPLLLYYLHLFVFISSCEFYVQSIEIITELLPICPAHSNADQWFVFNRGDLRIVDWPYVVNCWDVFCVCSSGIQLRSRKKLMIIELSSQTYEFPCRYLHYISSLKYILVPRYHLYHHFMLHYVSFSSGI